MKLNPYQPSVSNASSGNDDPWLGMVEKICFAPLVVLVVACIYHYSLIENPQLYRNSICIVVEVASLLVALVCVVIHFARFTSFCYLRKFRQALVSLFACIATFVVIVWAMWYDSPTILYAT